MNLYLFDEKEIILFTLPEKVIGNFWMTDGKGKNVININADNDEWVISGSDNANIIGKNDYYENLSLNLKNYYLIEKNSNKYVLYADNVYDDTYLQYNLNENAEIKIGKNSSCDIVFNNEYINDIHIVLNYNNNQWILQRDNNSRVYLNNNLLSESQIILKNGDEINIFGLKIVIAFNLFMINNPLNNIVINNKKLNYISLSVNDEIKDEVIQEQPLYKDDEYFFKSPRLRRIIETLDMNIDSPPQQENQQAMPMIYTLGPMLTMGASSVVNITDTMSKIGAGERTLSDSMPSLIVSGAMLCSMLVWPFLTKNYEKRQKKKREKKRQTKYKAYIEEKRKELSNEYKNQIQILEENLLSTEICYDTILNKKRTLWERKIEQSD